MQFQNIGFCLEVKAMAPADVRRLTGKLACSRTVRVFADVYEMSDSTMAYAALDAGIVFMRAVLGAEVLRMFSPSPLADAGWDIMADHDENPEEALFYTGFSRKLSVACGSEPVVLEHTKLLPSERLLAVEGRAVLNVVDEIIAQGLPCDIRFWMSTPPNPLPGPGCRPDIETLCHTPHRYTGADQLAMAA